MPDENPDPEAALKKLGERVRDGFAKTHPTPERSLNTVRDAVREQYEQEQKAERSKPIEPPSPSKERKPDEPGPER